MGTAAPRASGENSAEAYRRSGERGSEYVHFRSHFDGSWKAMLVSSPRSANSL